MKSLVFVSSVVVFAAALMVGDSEKFPDYADHECIRECNANSLPKTCMYHFTVEAYHTMSKACYNCPFNQTDCHRPHCVPAQGTSRGIAVVNRMLPGPSIQVCKGDTIVVKVVNYLMAEGTTIHWHGIHQRTSPYHDGVPMVTQCPIHPDTAFTYRFKADPAGTHYWHAHSALQRADGVFGSLIVRDTTYPNGALYDHDLPEHVVMVQDWLVEMSINRFTGHHHSDYDNKPKSGIINGMGAYQPHTESGDSIEFFTPRKVFTVEPGKKYRFRLISNAILNCPLKFSIDGHNMTFIASDGRSLEPFTADALVIYVGERYDFILETKNETTANYWMRIYGLADCSVRKVRQEAILRYSGAPEGNPAGGTTYEDADRQGMELNPLNTNLGSNMVPVLYMNNSFPDSENPDDKWNQPEADVKHYMSFDFNKIDNAIFHDPMYYPVMAIERSNHLYSPQINHISYKQPPSPPLSQYSDIPEELFCDMASMADKRCNETYCECIHRLKVPLDAVAELILVDNGVTFNANHPFHMHGYSFRVVGMERIRPEGVSLDEIRQMDENGELPRKLDRAVLKDTVTVPDGGYTIIRFHATNPGFWMMHCHIVFHAKIGMGVIIQVGEPSEMQKKPTNFPQCGEWQEDQDPKEPETNTEKQCPTLAPTNGSMGSVCSTWSMLLGLATSLLLVGGLGNNY